MVQEKLSCSQCIHVDIQSPFHCLIPWMTRAKNVILGSFWNEWIILICTCIYMYICACAWSSFLDIHTFYEITSITKGWTRLLKIFKTCSNKFVYICFSISHLCPCMLSRCLQKCITFHKTILNTNMGEEGFCVCVLACICIVQEMLSYPQCMPIVPIVV